MSDPREAPSADRPRVLVVEDDLQVVQGLISGLSRAGFAVEVAMDGTTGAARVLRESFDAVLLDLMLPGQDGFAVLEALEGRRSVPVIVLSARTELEARIRSFSLGAVDFVPKPFWMEELVARLRSRLNLRAAAPPKVIAVGGVDLDLDARVATRGGVDLGLTAAELNLLAWLAARPGRAVTRAQLVAHTLSAESGATERTVDSHMSRLRKKLGDDAACIKTVWGIGYRFDPPGPA